MGHHMWFHYADSAHSIPWHVIELQKHTLLMCCSDTEWFSQNPHLKHSISLPRQSLYLVTPLPHQRTTLFNAHHNT